MNGTRSVLVISLAALLGLPGCIPRRKQSDEQMQDMRRTEILTDVDIPVANGVMDQFFDEDSGEYALTDELTDQDTNIAANNEDHIDLTADSEKLDDFAWVTEDDSRESFRVIYFDFDSFEIRADQEDALSYNADLAQRMLQENADAVVTLVIEGHADHAAGSDAYNLALSEKRAKVLKDRLVASGVPADRIKVVGRGSEVPALAQGKPVHGDRNEQWPNRRDEIRIISA